MPHIDVPPPRKGSELSDIQSVLLDSQLSLLDLDMRVFIGMAQWEAPMSIVEV